MDINDLFKKTDANDQIAELKKGREQDPPKIADIEKQWDPAQHPIMIDKITFPDKKVVTTKKDAEGKVIESERYEKINRIALAFQKLIVWRTASFLFGNPLKILASDNNSKLAAFVRKILKRNKTKALDRRIARILFAATEVAEYWYPVEMKEEKDLYGSKSKYKMRCAVFSPLKGDQLFPYFDETGDLTAFSRQYQVDEDGKKITFFETWTDTDYYKWKQAGAGWTSVQEDGPVKLEIGKIPVVYACQEETEWADVQFSIERVEKLLSKFGNTNDYHGSPKIMVQGQVLGFSSKGEDGAILEMEAGAKAEYLSWDHAPESVKMEIETHLSMIYTMCRIANTSFDNLKGIGPLSGIALRLMFSDTDAKMTDKMEIFDDYMERRLNILMAFSAKMDTAFAAELDTLEMSVEQVPLILNDTGETVTNLVTSVSGGIMSKKTAVTKNPLVDDAEAEIKLLDAQAEAALKLANAAGGLDDQQNADE